MVLREASLSLDPAERVVVLGGNGAGKTTLTRLVAGLLRPDAGSVCVAGHPAGSSRAGRALGLLPERPILPRARSVEALLHTGLALSGARGRDPHAVLSELGLADLAPRRPRRLSQGQQRLVALALALVHDPALLVLDEPFTALDPEARGRVRAALAARPDTAILATAHHPDDVVGLDLRPLRLVDGRVEEGA